MNNQTLDKRLHDEVVRFTNIRDSRYNRSWTQFISSLESERAEKAISGDYDGVANAKYALTMAHLARKHERETLDKRTRDTIKPYIEVCDTLFDGNWTKMQRHMQLRQYQYSSAGKVAEAAKAARMIGFISLAQSDASYRKE